MRWPQWNPDRAGIIGAVSLTAVIVIVLALGAIYLPNLRQQRANAGFGPDWDCAVQARGDPVCTKKPAW
jgi:hypothetical protein